MNGVVKILKSMSSNKRAEPTSRSHGSIIHIVLFVHVEYEEQEVEYFQAGLATFEIVEDYKIGDYI